MLEVKLHDIGEGMSEGEIVHYLVKEGEEVVADQPLVEVQTDKMVAELPAPTSGEIQKIVIQTGETVQVGTTLMYIKPAAEITMGNKQEKESELINQSENRNENQQQNLQEKFGSSFQRVLATPFTRKIARDHHIDIEQVKGQDPSGRVREEDVYSYLKTIKPQGKDSEEKKVPAGEIAFEMKSKNTEEIPFRGIRKQIAKKMSKSLFTIPHVTHFDEVDMTNLFKLHETLKKDNISVSVVAFFVKALIVTLRDFPVFNAELDEKNEKIILKRDYHIGMATDTPEGLIVPTIQHADKKSIRTIHDEIKRFTARAKNNELKPEDLKPGTFTVSNVGPLGSTGATPVINYPQTALIAFHKTKKMPVVDENDDIIIRRMMNLSMSFDHRVADGASAVKFTNRFAELIENPGKLMLEMI